MGGLGRDETLRARRGGPLGPLSSLPYATHALRCATGAGAGREEG